MREKTKAISMLMRCSGQHTSSYRANMCLAARPDHEQTDCFSGHLQVGKVDLWIVFGGSPVTKRTLPSQIISCLTWVIPLYSYVVAGDHNHHHHIFCLTTGQQPLAKRALQRWRASASFFKFQYHLVYSRSSHRCLRILPHLPVNLLFFLPAPSGPLLYSPMPPLSSMSSCSCPSTCSSDL